MNKYKVCVYAICKNEENFIDRWMDSMREADEIIVTDTGSSDSTVEKLRRRGAVVYVDIITPWRFDTARNVSLGYVPEDADICVCTDLDEVFEKGWREKLEHAWTPQAKLAKYVYNWSLKADGSPDVQLYYSKIHTRQDFIWKYPVHEWLCYSSSAPLTTVFVDGMVLNHYPDNTKPRSSYLPLLEQAVSEDPMGDRVTYYLGREYMYKGDWQKCIDTLTRYLSLPTAVWNEERAAAMRWIAKSFDALGDNQAMAAWFWRAIAEAPEMRDPYVEFAKIAYHWNDWPVVFFMTEEALKITEKSTTFVNMGYAWDHTPYDLASIACYRLGLYARALQYAETAVRITPDDARLKNNAVIIREKIETMKKDSEQGQTNEQHQREKNGRLATTKLIHTMLFLVRENQQEEDLTMARSMLDSLQKSTYNTVVVFNQGYFTNDELSKYLSAFALDVHIIGGGANVGIPAGRQSCFQYIWSRFPDTEYISELHMDMILSRHWEDPLIDYLASHEEPMICSGIIDRNGEMLIYGKNVPLPSDYDAYDDFLVSLREDQILHGLTHPCIHVSRILREVGGYDVAFLKGKQCFEDDSLLLSYYYYYGTRSNWYPKISLKTVAFHAVAAQRYNLGDNIMINYNGLVRQYGAMGLKHLSEIHKSLWHKNYFGNNYNELAGIT